MVMIFQCEKVLRELIDSGIVYTFRTWEYEGRKLGKEWITYKRGGKKLGDVIVSLVSPHFVHPIKIYLEPFVQYSGFDSIEEWVKEIKKMSRVGFNDDYGNIYCVHLTSTNDDLVTKYLNGELNGSQG